MRRWPVLLLIPAGVCAAVAAHALHRMHGRRALVDVLPAFTEAGPGPRAPSTRALGFALGDSGLDGVRARLAAAGLSCPDTSMRALMREARERTRREMAVRKARGEDPDAVSGASGVDRPSPKEANPQVRLACAEVAPGALGLPELAAIPVRGRLLLVFDSPRHPLRHASFERSYPAGELAAALADLNDTRRRHAAVFGAPAGAAAGDTRELPWLSPAETAWRFADLHAKVSAIDWGPRGIVVSEIVEVPWPVRADAARRSSL
jgi:hypothetical protein